MSFQLALTRSPPLSEIFVFTDASPKDAHLFDVVKALALKKQSKVGFTSDPLECTEMYSGTLCGSKLMIQPLKHYKYIAGLSQ